MGYVEVVAHFTASHAAAPQLATGGIGDNFKNLFKNKYLHGYSAPRTIHGKLLATVRRHGGLHHGAHLVSRRSDDTSCQAPA
jgi:hypothetical protein